MVAVSERASRHVSICECRISSVTFARVPLDLEGLCILYCKVRLPFIFAFSNLVCLYGLKMLRTNGVEGVAGFGTAFEVRFAF